MPKLVTGTLLNLSFRVCSMPPTAEDAKHARNKELYDALMKGEEGRVIELCRQIPDGALYVLTIHKDTVLHMATYSKQKDLVLKLLDTVRPEGFGKMTRQNDVLNTVLHEAATSNRIVPAAKEMLRIAPKLLGMRNERGETALFRAARYGKHEMFELLDDEVNKLFESDGRDEARKAFHQRDDKTTILHMSILTEHFDLALSIATKYQYLIDAKDGDGMTALQLLSCNPSAFLGGSKQNNLKRVLFSCVSTEGMTSKEKVESFCRLPLWEALQKEKYRYESAVRLAKFLISKDTSWEATESAVGRSKLKTHKYGGFSVGSQAEGTAEGQKGAMSLVTSSVQIAETPLILATKSGIIEIVEEILKTYPQAVEYVDDEGRNILHVAVKYRQLHIFDLVEKMEIPTLRLIRKIDNNGNSILHMVGLRATVQAAEAMQSPALLLQEDLLLYERIEKISSAHFVKHFNSKGQTAETLFAENKDQLRTEAKDWLKGTAEHCSIVAVLIATVAFAAAYTVPGGPNESTGLPILLNHPFFVTFTMAVVLSLTFALTSVITFLSILTSPFRLKDFKHSLPQKLMLGVTLLILSVSMMMVAFAATIILMIRNKEQWTKIALYTVAFIPVTIFAFSYMPLYISLMKTFKYTFIKIGEFFPRFGKSQVTIHSNPIKSQPKKSNGSRNPSSSQATHSFV